MAEPPAGAGVPPQPKTAAPATTEASAKRPHPGSSPRPLGGQHGSGDARLNKDRRQRPPKKKLKGARRLKAVTDGTAEEVLLADVQALLKALKIKEENEVAASEPVLFHGSHGEEERAPGEEASAEEVAEELEQEEDLPEPGTEIELEVVDLSSTGEGLAVQRRLHAFTEGPHPRRRRRIYVVSFAVPGDIVRAKVYRHLGQPKLGLKEEGEELPPTYSMADFLEVIRPSPELRDPFGDRHSRVRCPYFGRCSGCQYQMLDYAEQLRIKRRVVERAYRHFSQLLPEAVPRVLDTVPSPLQYGYRTKLTPHFDGPPGFRRKNKAGHKLTAVPDIGFNAKGSRTTLDIEQCPIGTPAVVAGLARERARVARDYATYSRGATILLREDTKRYNKGEEPPPDELPDGAVRVDTDTHTDIKTCITDNNATATEYVGDYVFTNPAGSFFQNNNSILPALTAYVRENVRPKAIEGAPNPKHKELRYLIDAYSGSGLFTITLASTLPGGSVGIDIADQSITYARANAALNNLSPDRCRFLAADAAQLFAGVQSALEGFDPDETAVVLDPPRKGCDAAFLRQLLAFAPARIVYVSCNVHTQARDVGMLVRGEVDWGNGPRDNTTSKEGQEDSAETKTPGARYEIESLRGFDFFPQTAHVEGIAVLNRVDLL